MIRIVLVDDEEFILKGLKKLIERTGSQYQVVGSFLNSTEALAYIKDNYVEMLITDIRMPVMDGLKLVEETKKINEDIHCVILSGHSDFEYARNAMRIGVVDYLLKPIDDEELKTVLSKIVTRSPVSVESNTYYLKSNLSRDVAFIKNQIETDYQHFDLEVSVKKLDKTRDYLSKLFKNAMGISIKEYLRNVRIARAKELLESIDSYKVYEVGEQVGYTDVVYFSKQFKQVVGIGPKEYREKIFPHKID